MKLAVKIALGVTAGLVVGAALRGTLGPRQAGTGEVPKKGAPPTPAQRAPAWGYFADPRPWFESAKDHPHDPYRAYATARGALDLTARGVGEAVAFYRETGSEDARGSIETVLLAELEGLAKKVGEKLVQHKGVDSAAVAGLLDDLRAERWGSVALVLAAVGEKVLAAEVRVLSLLAQEDAEAAFLARRKLRGKISGGVPERKELLAAAFEDSADPEALVRRLGYKPGSSGYRDALEAWASGGQAESLVPALASGRVRLGTNFASRVMSALGKNHPALAERSIGQLSSAGAGLASSLSGLFEGISESDPERAARLLNGDVGLSSHYLASLSGKVAGNWIAQPSADIGVVADWIRAQNDGERALGNSVAAAVTSLSRSQDTIEKAFLLLERSRLSPLALGEALDSKGGKALFQHSGDRLIALTRGWPPVDAADVYATGIEVLAEENRFQEAARFADLAGGLSRNSYMASIELVAKWGLVRPRAAGLWLAGHSPPPGGKKDHYCRCARALVYNWASTDVGGALQWIGAQPDEHIRDHTSIELAAAVARSDPGRAFDLVGRVGDKEQVSEFLRGDGFASVSEVAPGLARQFVAGLDISDSEKRSALRRIERNVALEASFSGVGAGSAD